MSGQIMSTILVGCGNTLRGDDAIGIRAVEAFTASQKLNGVDTLTCHQYTPELAAELARYERVLFIDAQTPACKPANFPGKICLMDVEPVERPNRNGISHHLDVSDLLNLTKVLFGQAPRATLLTVEAANFNLSEHLSPEIEAVIPGLLKLIKSYCMAED